MIFTKIVQIRGTASKVPLQDNFFKNLRSLLRAPTLLNIFKFSLHLFFNRYEEDLRRVDFLLSQHNGIYLKYSYCITILYIYILECIADFLDRCHSCL